MGVFNITATDGTALAGKIYSPQSPRAVMTLVHGFGEHQGRYAHMSAHLTAHGIAVVTMDLRGHGVSGGARGVCLDYQFMLEDIGAQLTKAMRQFPGVPHFLYGHSMGGGLVLRYVSKAQRIGGLPGQNLRGVIASAPLISLPKPLPKLQIAGARLLRKFAPKTVIPNPISGEDISGLPAEQSLYEADTLNHGKLGVGLALDMIANGEIVLSRAKGIELPIMILHAKDDQLTSHSGSERFAALAPNCRLHSFENCQHEIHNDRPRVEVYERMLDFMNTDATA
jgi:alpha-beta hydrolase superfamily lysophospholipase